MVSFGVVFYKLRTWAKLKFKNLRQFLVARSMMKPSFMDMFSLEIDPSRARHSPRQLLLMTMNARERAWRLLKYNPPEFAYYFNHSSRAFQFVLTPSNRAHPLKNQLSLASLTSMLTPSLFGLVGTLECSKGRIDLWAGLRTSGLASDQSVHVHVELGDNIYEKVNFPPWPTFRLREYFRRKKAISNSGSIGREVRADQAGSSGLSMTVDWVLKTFSLLLFSSLLAGFTWRGELTECSKPACFAKRMLGMVILGVVVRGIDDRCRLLPDIVGVLVRSKASWGGEKIGQIQRIKTPKKKKKRSSTHESKFTNGSECRTEDGVDVWSTYCWVHARMPYAQLQLWAWFV